MELKYAAAACLLSIAAVMLISPLLCRSQRQCGIFSAALGIIIFRIVKSIFVECGWELAAAAGTNTGLFLEALMMGCGIVFFYEINKVFSESGSKKVFSSVGAVMVCTGKGLMLDSRLMSDGAVFIVGRASVIALLTFAVYYVREDSGERQAKSLSGFTAICAIISLLPELLTRQYVHSETKPSAAMLIMLGCCELMFELSNALKNMKNTSEISAAGLAAGIMLSCGLESLAG